MTSKRTGNSNSNGKGNGKSNGHGKEQAGERFENPLMPDERLRQMYTAMVQVRMIEEHLLAKGSRARGQGEIATIRGEEAARAGTALSLEVGDLLSDCFAAPGMDLLLGASVAAVRRSAGRRGGSVKKDAEEGASHALRLSISEDGEERVQMALGAAAALRVQGGGRALLVYVRAGEVGAKRWKRVLRRAGERELPVIFVVLPDAEGEGSPELGELARRARGWGVPGFPVDGTDAIGLYRVMQESLLRARTEGGPALIECVRFKVHGVKQQQREDPVERLGKLMLAKGAATPEWLQRTRSAFRRRLGGARR